MNLVGNPREGTYTCWREERMGKGNNKGTGTISLAMQARTIK